MTLIEDEERPWETANPPAAAITTAPRARIFHARGVTQRISTCVEDSEITQPGDAPVQASLMRLDPGSGAYIDALLRECSGMSPDSDSLASAANADDDNPAEGAAVYLEGVAAPCSDEGGGREEAIFRLRDGALIRARFPVQLP